MAKKKQAEKLFISYNASQAISAMVRGFKTSTYADYEKIKSIIEASKKVSDEFQEKIQEKLTKVGVQELTKDHKDFDKINNELGELFTQASSIEVKELQVFTKKELHSAIDGVDMSFDERDLLEKALVK